MRPVIEFCSGNNHHGTDDLLRQLALDPDYDVVEYGCLGNCGECYMFPYVMVNGETVAAETPEQLLELIMQKIEEIKKWEQPHSE